MQTQLQIKMSVFVWSLLIMIMIFIAVALCAALIPAPNSMVQALFQKFSLGSERSPPAFFSFLLLLTCAVWLGVTAIHERQQGSRWWRHWAFLAIMFVLMSYDDAAQIHERWIEPLRELLGVGGFFYYAWVIPAIILVAVIFIAYLPFLFHLPPVFAGLFVVSGAIFVGGAVGIEMISAKYIDDYGKDLIYKLITTVEESFELVGLWLFIYSLMKYLTRQAGAFELRLQLTNGAAVPVTAKPKRSRAGLEWVR